MRSFFLSRQLREKLLLVVFILLGAAIWGSNVLQRSTQAGSRFQQAGSTLREQKQWLDQRARIEAAAEAAVADLDASRTFNSVRLSAELSAIANATGLGANAVSEPGRTEITPQFAMHTLQFRLNRVEYEQLQRFYGELSRRAPYINIERFSVAADRARPQQLNAALVVSSVEITR
jgi:hypothetical protein